MIRCDKERERLCSGSCSANRYWKETNSLPSTIMGKIDLKNWLKVKEGEMGERKDCVYGLCFVFMGRSQMNNEATNILH